ncbi:hypothetical protein F5878DRAFT_682648 [Lentinula raphanica]|uniref:Uncharacterized protein n=1 Tax=Lentinula raphanica TaxID=153919 RepID=A0AA38P8L5_9AGAR|nr:hypothetical protein F5878DRAFT_682648 [Lentinula raphanica]
MDETGCCITSSTSYWTPGFRIGQKNKEGGERPLPLRQRGVEELGITLSHPPPSQSSLNVNAKHNRPNGYRFITNELDLRAFLILHPSKIATTPTSPFSWVSLAPSSLFTSALIHEKADERADNHVIEFERDRGSLTAGRWDRGRTWTYVGIEQCIPSLLEEDHGMSVVSEMTKSLEFGKVLDGMVREKGTGAGGVLSKEKDEWEWEVYERIKLGGAVIPEDSSKRQKRDVLEDFTPSQHLPLPVTSPQAWNPPLPVTSPQAWNPPLPATPSQHPPLPAWALKEQDVHTDPRHSTTGTPILRVITRTYNYDDPIGIQYEPVRVNGYLEMNRTVVDVDVTYFWYKKFSETLFGIEIYT